MFKVVLASALVFSANGARVARPEHWQTTSTTPSSISMDVIFAPNQITFINKKSLPLGEGSKVSTFIGNGRKTEAMVYKVAAPTDFQLIRGNHLCDSHPVTYVVVWNPPKSGGPVAPRSLGLCYGSAMTRSDGEPSSRGTFNYDAAAP